MRRPRAARCGRRGRPGAAGRPTSRSCSSSGGADAGAGADVGVEAQGPAPGRGSAGDAAVLLDHRAPGARRRDRRRLHLPRSARAEGVPLRALRVQQLRERPRARHRRLRRLERALRSVDRDRRRLGGRQRGPAPDRSPADQRLSLGQQLDGHHDVHRAGVRRAARAGSSSHPSPMLVVQADAWMASGIQTSGDVTVAGTLHVPAGEPTDVSGTFNHGAIDGTSFPVLPACDCASSDFVDIAGVVATYEAHNDDAALGISSTMLENVQSDTSMNLPCGRIYLTRIGANAPVHLTAQGHVAPVRRRRPVDDVRLRDRRAGGERDRSLRGRERHRERPLSGGLPVEPGARAHLRRGEHREPAERRHARGQPLRAGRDDHARWNGARRRSTDPSSRRRLSSGSDLTIHYDEAILTPSSTPACAVPSTCATLQRLQRPGLQQRRCAGPAPRAASAARR